jgi:hypothetical protein
MNEERVKQAGVFIAVVTIIGLPIILFCVFGNTGVEMASIIVTGLLTLALVHLYFQQYRVLDTQTKIMERNYKSDLGVKGQIYAEDDKLFINLRNMGRGAIKTIYLKTEITSDTGKLTIEPGHKQLLRSDDKSAPLPPFSDVHEYVGEVRMKYPNEDPPNVLPFSYFSGRLYGHGIKSCTIKITLEIIDEATIDKDHIDEMVIAEQELDLSENDDTEKGSSKKLSDVIKPEAPQDILPKNDPVFGDVEE